ncbi:B12-binding domain-containing radical SAM protein [candidate division CSSED10-310 bacterium]|uniref:B12-binding domain-containing radical SAM protein n=1 Tax=candidate division CSSED10-310 bacterium TaxID=2855610 RepID=A0ABV6YQU1_UNCC1
MPANFSVSLVHCPFWGVECPPLPLSLLAGNLRTKGFTVHLFDLNIEFYHLVTTKQKTVWLEELGLLRFSENYLKSLMQEYHDQIEKQICQIIGRGSQLVGFSLYESTIFYSLEIIKRLKARSPDTLVVLGGRSTTANAGSNGLELLKNPNVDAVVFGEGDETLPEMCAILKDNGHFEKIPGLAFKEDDKIIHGGMRDPIPSLDAIPFSDYSEYNLNRYTNSELALFSSRGCVNRCHFCRDNLFKGLRARSGKNLFEEVHHHLSQHPDVKLFNISDSALNGSLKTIAEFSELLLKNNIKIMWGGFAIVRNDMTPELLKLMAQAGCIYLGYGIESGSITVRESMNKQRFTNETAAKVLKDTHDAGIKAYANFMFGFPTETEEDFQMTLNFILHNHKWIDHVIPSISLTALLPDTYLYNNSEEFSIEKSKKHIIFWETKDGESTFLTRMERHKRFCSLCLDLGFGITDPDEKEEKWRLWGSYYSYKGNHEKVLECYKNELTKHGKSQEAIIYFHDCGLKYEEMDSLFPFEG